MNAGSPSEFQKASDGQEIGSTAKACDSKLTGKGHFLHHARKKQSADSHKTKKVGPVGRPDSKKENAHGIITGRVAMRVDYYGRIKVVVVL